MVALDQLTQHPNTVVIEDAAHALGSQYPDGRKVGCCHHSDMTIFSFHPAKTITCGEGGMVLTNILPLAQRLRLFRDNGIERPLPADNPNPWFYAVHAATGNFNMTEFQAALGLSQLQKLDTFVSKRQQLMRTYAKHLESVGGVQMLAQEISDAIAYHLCVVRIDFSAYQTSRTAVMQRMRDKEIGTQVHYIPLYTHPFFREKPIDGDFPEMEKYYAQALSLPLFYAMEEEDVSRVCCALREALEGA